MNADVLVSTGQGLIGNNMFVYCLNNPIVLSDLHGTVSKSCLHDFTEPRLPWMDSGSGGGRPHRDYSSGSNYYGEIADKFYTLRALKWLGIDELSDVRSVSRIATGGYSIVKGFGLILFPFPSIEDDLYGMYKITKGVIDVCWGLAEWIGELNGL